MEKLEKPNYRGRREGGGCLDESLCWMEFFPKCNNRRGAGEAGWGGGWNKNVLAGKILKN